MIGAKGAAIRALGLRNVVRVGVYRALLRAGVHPVQHLRPRALPIGEFFGRVTAALPAIAGVSEQLTAFGWFVLSTDEPPDWHCDLLTGARVADASSPWWKIGDFSSGVRDIKTVWEASRLDWAVFFALRARLGDSDALASLNEWLRDWTTHNPAYCGPNWKCGQEASIRVMHLAVAALVLRQHETPKHVLLAMLEQHLERIAPTISYAIGQDNNHGTSEAAALVIGGSWLERHGVTRGAAWHATGRALLAERVERLVQSDGSFSQYSVNYHRLALDTLSLVEVWRRALGFDPFAAVVGARAVSAMRWLHGMTDADTGGAPNIGANDGANLLPITASAYRDYRPSVHLAAAVWLGQQAYPSDGPWHATPLALGVAAPAGLISPPTSVVREQGGYVVLRRGTAGVLAVLRFPRYRFRPSHADPLHVDLWIGGRNVLRDGGSYSYAAEPRWQDYFTGVRAHNTVQFDDREPMPRLGRFLWGAWLRTNSLESIDESYASSVAAAGYEDWHNAKHHRRVTVDDRALTVVDSVGGFASRAVLRWRLAPGEWQLNGQQLRNGTHKVTLSCDVPVSRIALVEGWESRHYLRKTCVPVLEFEIGEPGTITTEYRWTT